VLLIVLAYILIVLICIPITIATAIALRREWKRLGRRK